MYILCRWVCTSGQQQDLEKTDEIAAAVLEDIMKGEGGCQTVCLLGLMYGNLRASDFVFYGL